MWDKIKAWFKNSMTILWARVVALAGIVLAFLPTLTADPTIGAAVQAALQPRFVVYYLIAIGVITEIARRRTVSKPTDDDNHVVG